MLVRGEASAGQDFVITRAFEAPRALVWQAWTAPGHLAQWWGPKGCTIRVVSLDVCPGGIFHFEMQWPEGRSMWARFVYREVVPPEKLVYVSSFSDADGNLKRAPFEETFPLAVLYTVTFEDKGATTLIALRGTPLDASDAERATFAGMFQSMRQGFGGTFDQLATYLSKG